MELIETLFNDFNQQLDQRVYKAQKSQIVDASFVDAPRQRNTREENEQIKTGQTPAGFQNNTYVRAQKDTDARWAKKNQETHYGYKNHVVVDNKYKLIRNYQITSAEVHDSQVFVELLTENSVKDVWADSAYRSKEAEKALATQQYRSHVHKKGKRNQPLTETDKQANRRKSNSPRASRARIWLHQQ